MSCFEIPLHERLTQPRPARLPSSRLSGDYGPETASSEIELLHAETERWSAEQVLEWGFDQFSPNIAIASGFGAEGMALIDLASRVRSGFRVFTLDTGFFFPETYELIEKVEHRYRIQVERCRPALTPVGQSRSHGEALWARDPDRCCKLRKVEPLKRKLSELTAWVAAVRRDQTAARAGTPKIEWDRRFELVKLNPLADWTSDRVWDYIRANHVPYNPLHDLSYPSIGCTHCTRPVRIGENPRAGRWAGFEKTECGLHTTD
ncbi:MAG TPA: phosphoadenylyl-sulfate reductase [Terriglobia bacterium]